jgi:DNA helicase-2/ATP-dependent DNA helicase PcrA
LTAKRIRGGDIAVLFRTNAQSRSFEEAFRRGKIPYVLVGGTSFYERMEVKDCLAFLRLLVNPRDAISFERIYNKPARGLGDKAFETLTLKAQQLGRSHLETLLSVDPDELGSRSRSGFSDLKTVFELLFVSYNQKAKPIEILKQILDLTGYLQALTSEDSVENQSRVENIQELGNALAIWSDENPEKGLSDFLEEVSLVSDIDSWEKKEQSVNVMTLHSAKGLEFKHVFFVGLEDGIIPSKQNFEDEEAIEEERRLMYVGVTRAIDQLECSYVEHRWRFGELLPQQPSRFLQPIPGDLFLYNNCSTFFGEAKPAQESAHKTLRAVPVPSQGYRESRASEKTVEPSFEDYSQDTLEYRIGQYVKHKMYGRGRILSISGFGADMKLTILFNDGNRKKLMAKFASLE